MVSSDAAGHWVQSDVSDARTGRRGLVHSIPSYPPCLAAREEDGARLRTDKSDRANPRRRTRNNMPRTSVIAGLLAIACTWCAMETLRLWAASSAASPRRLQTAVPRLRLPALNRTLKSLRFHCQRHLAPCLPVLRGGSGSDIDWPYADLLNASHTTAGAAASGVEEEEVDDSDKEESCSEALQRMAALVEGAREQRVGLADVYALLNDLEHEGVAVNTQVFNTALRVVVELASRGEAATVDGERLVERLEDEGLRLDEDTYLQMMLIIGAGARHKDPVPRGFLSEGWDWLTRMDESGMEIPEAVVDAYIEIYHAQMPNVYELDPWG